MTLKTHFETGIAFSLLISGIMIPNIDAMDVSSASKIGILGAILIGVASGSVYNDIDFDKSNLNADDVDLRWENKFDHRGIIHTLINAVGVFLPFLLLTFLLNKVTFLDITWITVLGLSMSVGCVWHMVIDSFTPKGIMWLYPISKYRFRIPIVRNYATERILRILVTGILLYGAIKLWTTYPY